jgi:hypothetical protein
MRVRRSSEVTVFMVSASYVFLVRSASRPLRDINQRAEVKHTRNDTVRLSHKKRFCLF